MNFDGHEIYKINRNWIFDLTTFTGYKVKIHKDKIVNFDKAFVIKDQNKGETFELIKYRYDIPLGIIRKSKEVIKNYYKEALIYE